MSARHKAALAACGPCDPPTPCFVRDLPPGVADLKCTETEEFSRKRAVFTSRGPHQPWNCTKTEPKCTKRGHNAPQNLTHTKGALGKLRKPKGGGCEVTQVSPHTCAPRPPCNCLLVRRDKKQNSVAHPNRPGGLSPGVVRARPHPRSARPPRHARDAGNPQAGLGGRGWR